VQRLESRCASQISLVVIHCTELPDMAMARQWGEKVLHAGSQTGNCGHYYIDRDGSIEEWVPPTRIAHHVRGFNTHSIGIELVNIGRYPDWFRSGQQLMTEDYPAEQIRALAHLLEHLRESLPSLHKIAGHEDLDTGMLPAEDNPEVRIRRKIDPGPRFPWSAIMDNTKLKRLTEKEI
jgi:N-acetylmuramoyl-L-alanine amidase